MTVDEILATGKYTDRRGREWDYLDMRVDYDRWKRWESRGEEDLILDPAEMRLLIERDQHRDECVGLPVCTSHPVPIVIVALDPPGNWHWFKIRYKGVATLRESLTEAMDAARALAVGE